MEEKKTKTYESSNIIERPFVMYGTLNLDESQRYTYADYLTWLDDRRMELIDGFIHFLSTPNTLHARISSNLCFQTGDFIHERNDKSHIYHAPFDVRLPLCESKEDDKIYDVVQPDICVICDLSKLDDKGCIGAPDLVVEVLSPSTLKYDWNYKFNLYEAAGVREYWIVDPKAKTVNVFLLQPDGKYDLGTVYECHQKVPVRIFEGLEIDLNELFE